MYSPQAKIHNCTWIFTLGDADDKPSVPHAHAQEYGYRLDAWTGYIFPAGKERDRRLGRLKPKELRQLHSDKGFLDFANKQINWYRETYPHICFYVPEWFELRQKNGIQYYIKNEYVKDVDVFIWKPSANQRW